MRIGQVSGNKGQYMKRSVKVILTILSTLLLFAVIWVVLALYVFTGVHRYVPDPVYSADGSRVIIPSVDYNKNNHDVYLMVHIEVQDTKTGKILFQIQTRASDRMRWSVGWVDDNTVKLDSSDIGTYCWTGSDVETWKERICP